MMVKLKKNLTGRWIMKSDGDFLFDVIQKTVIRFLQLHPEEELLVLSLPKHDTRERSRCIDEMVSFLKSYTYRDSRSSGQ